MTSILQILLESTQTRKTPEALEQKRDRFLIYENQVSEQLGWHFTMELESAWDELHAAELDRAYEQGFLAAFRLWQEITLLAHDV